MTYQVVVQPSAQAEMEEAYRWVEAFGEKGFRDVIRDRDRPWGDYGERNKAED